MTWYIDEPATLDELKRKLWDKSDKQLAYRGQENRDWNLRPMFDRKVSDALAVRTRDAYAERLQQERMLLNDFAQKSRRFVSGQERRFIDGYRDAPTGPHVWDLIGIARHYGLATRALDWTSSILIAAYFAALGPEDKDGVVWWFNQKELESVLDPAWDSWDVPKRPNDRSGQRAIETRAFRENYEHRWVTKLHFPLPFPRMEAQRAFLTVGSRLGVNHCEAIDELGVDGKGQIVVRGDQKAALLQYLEEIGISAHSLGYPGADLIAGKINKKALAE